MRSRYTQLCSQDFSRCSKCVISENLVPGTAFYADGFGSWSLRLSYCYPTPERIREGVKALGGVIKQEMASRKGFELKG